MVESARLRKHRAVSIGRFFMPLSNPAPRRQLRHTRNIAVAVYARADGGWDLDAHITDVKAQDAQMSYGLHPAGVPVHDLWLRVTIDSAFNIRAAQAAADNVPFAHACPRIYPDYAQKLQGQSLLNGVRQRLQQALGGVLGCTHLTELAQALPTAAIQAMAGEPGMQVDPDKKPFYIDQCHAMRADGDVVLQFYPRWATGPS